MKIKTAVIPVAGKGTRFLPATKETPKEMIPILTKPMIQYVVEEAVFSGIEKIVFVTSSTKNSIVKYFDRNAGLEAYLKAAGKNRELELIKNIGDMIEVVTVIQKEQLGLGHAVMCAESVVRDDHFSVILGDDLIFNKDQAVTDQLIKESERLGGASVVGVMRVDPALTFKYGIVQGEFINDSKTTLKMEKMIEKPSSEDAPTNLATPGRYILSQQIFEALHNIPKGVGGEYQLTDAINELCCNGNVYAHIFKGRRYDTGTLPGYLEATLDLALENKDTREIMEKLIKDRYAKL